MVSVDFMKIKLFCIMIHEKLASIVNDKGKTPQEDVEILDELYTI